jgi:precorrin-6B methylase 2
MITDLILIAIILFAAYLIASIFYPMVAGGAGFEPTPKKVIGEALKLASLKQGEVFYDLGCGTGGVLVAASRFSDHVKGVEIEPLRWLISRLRTRKAQVIWGNLYKQDISDADVIFIFQYPGKTNNRIVAKIRSEARRGTRVVSYCHQLDGIKLVRRQGRIFLYQI